MMREANNMISCFRNTAPAPNFPEQMYAIGTWRAVVTQ